MIRPILILMLLSTPALAFKWPWEHIRYQHRHITKHQSTTTTKVSCDDINAAIKMMDTEHLAEALKLSTANQKRAIEKCQMLPK